MDALHAQETRHVEWRWAGRSEAVTLPRERWQLFDRLCEHDGEEDEALHLRISLLYPYEASASIAASIERYLDSRLAPENGRHLAADATDLPSNETDDMQPRKDRGPSLGR